MGNNALHLLDVVAHGLLYSAGLPAGKKEMCIRDSHIMKFLAQMCQQLFTKHLKKQLLQMMFI